MSQFSRPQPKYDPQDESRFRDDVSTALDKAYVRQQSIEMWTGTSVFMRSPDNNRWQITVSNAGVIVVTAA